MGDKNIANKDEADKCLGIGRKALQLGDYDKAIKWLEKSHRLYELPGVQGMINRAKQDKMLAQAKAEAQAKKKQDAARNGQSTNNRYDRYAQNNSNSNQGSNGEGVRRRGSGTRRAPR